MHRRVLENGIFLEPLHKNGVNAIVVAKAPADCLFTASRDSIIR